MTNQECINKLKEYLGEDAEIFWAYTSGMVKYIYTRKEDFFRNFFRENFFMYINAEIHYFTNTNILSCLKGNKEALIEYAYEQVLSCTEIADYSYRKNTLFEFYFGKKLNNEPSQNKVPFETLLLFLSETPIKSQHPDDYSGKKVSFNHVITCLCPICDLHLNGEVILEDLGDFVIIKNHKIKKSLIKSIS